MRTGAQNGRALAASLVAGLSTAVLAESVRFDFESGDLQGWRVAEGAFAQPVTDRSDYHNGGRYETRQGKYHLSTVEGIKGVSADYQLGVIESPVFVLQEPKISFLIGGGNDELTYVALCTIDGNERSRACGRQDEKMTRQAWDLPELVGKKVFLRVVDGSAGEWGHVTLDDVAAAGSLDARATDERFAARRRCVLPVWAQRGATPEAALRLAVEDLIATFGDQYAGGRVFLARLDELVRKGASETSPEFGALQREALMANPLVCGQPILYVWRSQYKQGGFHAIDTLFHTGEANTGCFTGPGALKTLDVKTGRVLALVEANDGIVRDPEVHFDGRRIVFALRRNIREDYHIWEVNADGSGLHQLTRAEGVSDFDPLYLPDGRIAFSSTREPKYNQCSRDIGANLFAMEADGANVHQISKNNLFDSQGSLTPGGQILYARWEYVDRNFGDAHSVWTLNPDGTCPALYWGNNTASPGGVYYPRLVPDSEALLCIFGMHHNRMWGALALLDRRKAMDGRPAVVRTWPEDAVQRVRAGGPFDCDNFVSVYPKYECPFPLSEKYFLCSRMTMRPGQTWVEGDASFGHEMGIYLVDVFGNEIQVHADDPGCFDPMPLAPSARPPVLPCQRDFENKDGYFYIADVYEGTHMKGVQRGSVKTLRVVESPEKRFWSRGAWYGQGYTAPGMNWHSLENKRILGTVPVGADGSAYFAVPHERFVYFQLLDENGMMIQSMRSGVSVQSGEYRGCGGCHESRLASQSGAPAAQAGAAMRRTPSQLENKFGPVCEFGFAEEVQPIFTRRCVSCHDYGKKAGKKLNLAPDRTLTFNTAYVELWRKGYTGCVGAGPAEVQQAYSWGSHASRLIKELRHPSVPEHKGLTLSAEELGRIITWIDLNGVYYSTYAAAYPDSPTGRSPLDDGQVRRLEALTGMPILDRQNYANNVGPELSFERPELSPCLEKLERNGAAYQEALAIIRTGKERLEKCPRADMPGFRPCETDVRREEKYERRQRIEQRVRDAIRKGERAYDE